MQHCNLNADILAIVLRKCVGTGSETTKELKRKLPLLAVCRLWRHIAIPLVHSRLFIQYGVRSERVPGVFVRNHNIPEPANVAVKTNLDLIAMVGCARAVRRVNIEVYCMVNPFPGWREVIQRMRSVASNWRVFELEVAMRPDNFHFNGKKVVMSKYTDDIAEVGDALVALMPGVCRLECRGSSNNPIAWSLYGHLASHHADQLQWFNSRHPISIPLDCRLAKLKGLRICCDSVADYQFPQMASGEVVDMRLTSGPANHSWAPFSADSDSHEIEFTKLETLHALYDTVYEKEEIVVRHRDGRPWKLRFPSLKSLDIDCSQDICPLLEYAVLPPRMESISIAMKPSAYLEFANLVLPAVKRLSLSIGADQSGDSSGLPAVNRILESARACESLSLTISDRLLQIVPESITCMALTHLRITATTSVDAMLTFIERLPKLAELTIMYLDLSDTQTDLFVPDADASAAIEPLSRSLKSLALNYDTRLHSPDTSVAVVKYILLGTPALTELLAMQTPKSVVLGFVEEYAPRHPHLSSVELILWSDEWLEEDV